MHITAILIAAGLSARMQGPNKLLKDISNGERLIERTYTELANATIDQLIVVTGRDADAVQSFITKTQITKPTFIHNANFEQGMTSSIQAGLAATEQTEAIMICLSDMPLLTTADYNALLAEFRSAKNYEAILAPFKKNKKGHPVLFGSAHFKAIAEHTEMNGCSAIVKANDAHLIKFTTSSDHYFFDIDTPENLAQFKARVN